MSRRQQQHHGSSAGDDRELPGRDVEGSPEAGDEVHRAVEDARDVTRLIDHNEGYDRQDNRDPQSGASRGPKTQN